ncbi:hypothetical protein [Streptomyces sp. WAC 04229]|uniref:hypothetical protein n=1 Tax=Streptomyces sp. WAC 04229 TaxID=2203206 RepID=UPI0021AD5B33|nr:hypothetical protein [Streptomyces sp. WAC 04229]
MTASGPDRGATPGEPDEPGGTPPVPEHVWRLFLEDDELAIRASAPREPSARDRTAGRRPGPPATGPSGPPYARPALAAGTVGEAWRPEDPWAGPGPRPPAPPATGPSGPPYARPALAAGTVGEAWRPEDPWAGPGWRELDRRARLRRLGRVIGTATAVALALTAWSQLSTGPDTPGGEPADTIGRRLDDGPALPTLASLAPSESGTASPAAFEPAPSAIPRASASPWTID